MQINRTRANSVVPIVFTGRCKPGIIDFSEAVVFQNRICAGSEKTKQAKAAVYKKRKWEKYSCLYSLI